MRTVPGVGWDTLNFLVTDHLGGTAMVTTEANPATEVGEARYLPFGSHRAQSGTVPTDKRYTGQQLETPGGAFWKF
jgi:hypothetical protein